MTPTIQQRFETFFFDEIIYTTFEEACAKIKEFNQDFELKKIDNNGNFNIINKNTLFATFTTEGITFK